MNFPMFKLALKNNWALWLIFTVITVAYLLLIIAMYDPENMQSIEAAIEMAPAGLAAAVGMDRIPVNLTDFAANYFYRFLVQIFLIIHVTILPIRLVVKQVDDGTMSYLLSTKVSRFKVIFTKAMYMIISLFAMSVVLTGIAILVSVTKFPVGELDIFAFLSLNLATFLVATAMAAIVFFFSSIMNQTSHATFSGAGILLIFFIFSLIEKIGHGKGFYGLLGKFSIFRFLQAREIVAGEINMYVNDSWLLLIIAVFLGMGIYFFSKRDLPL